MQQNGLDKDLLKNGSMDFASNGNWKEPNDTLSIESGSMFSTDLDLELWSDSGWCMLGVLGQK